MFYDGIPTRSLIQEGGPYQAAMDALPFLDGSSSRLFLWTWLGLLVLAMLLVTRGDTDFVTVRPALSGSAAVPP